MHVLDGRSEAASEPSEPLRNDGTDHLPSRGIEYGMGTFEGVQTTLDGGVIRPPSAEPAEPAAAAGTDSSSGSAGGSASAAMPPPPPPSAAQREAAQRMTTLLMAAGRTKAAGKLPAAVPPRAVFA